MTKLILKRLKQIMFVIGISCLSTSAFALHDKSSACGKGHEGWKQDCSKNIKSATTYETTTYGAPSPQMGATINGLLLALLMMGFYYKKTHPSSKKEHAD
jgi:hypothetical protein